MHIRALPFGLVAEGIEAQCLIIACVPSSIHAAEGFEGVCLTCEVAAEGVGNGGRIGDAAIHKGLQKGVVSDVHATVIRWQDGAEDVRHVGTDAAA